jgi:GNS1/SUR4 family
MPGESECSLLFVQQQTNNINNNTHFRILYLSINLSISGIRLCTYIYELTICSFEVGYDPVPVRDWMVSAPWLPIMAIVLYGLMILIGTPYFAKRNPWNWRRALAFWNFALAAFSAIGFVRVVPQVMHNLMYFSLHDNMCADPEAHYGSGSTGLWVQLFVLSKFP